MSISHEGTLAASKKDQWVALLLLLFLLPAAALATPIYMGVILLAGLGRLVYPQIGDNEKVLGGLLQGGFVKTYASALRMVEMVGESYPQALFGESALTWLIQHHNQHHNPHSPSPSIYIGSYSSSSSPITIVFVIIIIIIYDCSHYLLTSRFLLLCIIIIIIISCC